LFEAGDEPEDFAADYGCGIILLEDGGDRIDRYSLGFIFGKGILNPFDQGGEIKITDDFLPFRIG
jgi:hypothetical protein